MSAAALVVEPEAIRIGHRKGRPSGVTPFFPFIRELLRETPWVTSAEIFRLLKSAGYPGQASAVYAAVGELRGAVPMGEPNGQAPREQFSAEPFRAFILEQLHADPTVRTDFILGRARAVGYAGGRNAMYSMVSKLRKDGGLRSPAEIRAARREERRRNAEMRRVEHAESRAQRAAQADERRQRKAREREDRRAAAARLAEERGRERAALTALSLPQNGGDPARLRAIGRMWLASRTNTHKDAINERSRWRRHLEPAFGDLLPGDVNAGWIRAFVEEKLATGLSSTSVGRCVGLLSTFFTDLVERGLATRNPVEAVPRAVRRLYRNRHDPRNTPFLETEADIRKVRDQLTGMLRALFSLGVTTGLRTGELRPLEKRDVNFALRRICVMRRLRDGRIDTPKSGRGRIVPLSSLAIDVLQQQMSGTGDSPLVFPPPGRARFVGLAAFRDEWRAALDRAGLPQMRFYDATRHTFASQWVLKGLPIEKLSKILGHSTIMMTERYAHLKPEALTVPDLFSFGADETEGGA